MANIPQSVIDKVAYLEVKDVDENCKGLTQWEIDFVESLIKQLLEGKVLSGKQITVLRRIKEEKDG